MGESMAHRFRPQRFLVGALIVAVVLVAVRILAIQGLVTPVRVVSGSMADRLWGEHYLVTCADCAFVFPFGVESPAVNERAVCPNCGYEKNLPRREWRRRGDKVMIDRAAYWGSAPRRWDLVAVRDPRVPARLLVKRTVGLPGERIAIRHGDLFANGQPIRKSLPEWRRLRLLVHEQSHSPPESRHLPSRWREDSAAPQWRVEQGRIQFQPNTEQPGQESWLEYHHWRCFANPFPRGSEAPVADNYGYNQGETRELRPVADVQLQCQVDVTVKPRFSLRIHDGREWFIAQVDLAGRTAEAHRGDVAWTRQAIPPAALDPANLVEVEFGLVDRQLILALNRVEIWRLPYESSEQPFVLRASPLGIGGRDTPLTVTDVRVWRDVHYLDPWGVGRWWETSTVAGPDEFLLLGDNPPLSDDSRRWDSPWLPRSKLVGKVIPLPR